MSRQPYASPTSFGVTGYNIPELFTLLSRVRSQEEPGTAVVTRSKQQSEARVRNLHSGAKPTSIDEPTAKERGLDTCDVPEVLNYDCVPGAAFNQDLFMGGRPRKILTRSQKRVRRKEHSEHGPSRAQNTRNGGSVQKTAERRRDPEGDP